MVKDYQNKQVFLEKIKDYLLAENNPVGDQTGWKRFGNEYIHYKNGGYENDPKYDVCILKFDSLGNLIEERSRIDGVAHKEDGPAVVNYSGGKVVGQQYYLKGMEQTTEASYLEKLKSIKRKYISYTSSENKTVKFEQQLIRDFFSHMVEVDEFGNITNNITDLKKYGVLKPNLKNELLINNIENNNTAVVFSLTREKAMLGPAQCSIKNGLISNPRYIISPNMTVTCSAPEWTNYVSKVKDGLPNWVRYSQLNNLGVDVETIVPKRIILKSEETAFAKSFLSDKTKRVAIYENSKSELIVAFKDPKNDTFYQKTIPLETKFLIKDGCSYIDNSFENKPKTYEMASFEFNNEGELRILNSSTITSQQYKAAIENSITSNNKLFLGDSPSELQEIVNTKTKQLETLQTIIENQKAKMAEITENAQKFQKEFENKLKEADNKAAQAKSLKELETKIEELETLIERRRKLSEIQEYYSRDNLFNHDFVKNIDREIIKDLIESESQKVKSESKIITTVKSDAKEVAKRIAVSKITKLISDSIIKLFNLKAKGKTKEDIEAFFNSEKGKALISVATGMLLPMIGEKLPEKYKELIMEFSEEFRISGETAIASEFADFVTGPLFASVSDSLAAAELFSGNKTELVRVEIPAAAMVKTAENNSSEEEYSEVKSSPVDAKTLN